jgi:hypothetical protein
MQIAGEIAEFDRIGDGAWLQAQPALLCHADDYGAVILQHQHSAVEQPLITRQSNRHFGAALGSPAQAMSRNIRRRHGQEIDGAAVLQLVNPLSKGWVKTAAEHVLDPQHRNSPGRDLSIDVRSFVGRTSRAPMATTPFKSNGANHMIHYVGIRVHPFRGAGCCGLHLVIEAVQSFMRIKFAAANTAEDNEKDVCAATERGTAFRSLKQDWQQKSGQGCVWIRAQKRLRPPPAYRASDLAVRDYPRPRTNARGRRRQFHSVRTPIISGIKIA